MKQPQGLISVLLDKTARDDERHDAAMDLSKYPEHSSLEALINIASDPAETFLADVAGESIAIIWVKLNSFDVASYEKLVPMARSEAYATIEENKPDWIEKYRITE